MPSLEEIVQALLESRAYPGAPAKVELMQTGNSLIFLAGEYVYKVKKPVSLGYLDYSTLEKRLYYCQREIELNRRLCAHAYLGVVPITAEKGRLRVEGEGQPIEYAVKMRYLPQDRMLNVLLPARQVTAEMVTAVAHRLADFHALAATSPEINNFGSVEIVTTNSEENFSRTERYIGSAISRQGYNRLKTYSDAFIKANSNLFSKRVTGGKIKDCHGDLHTAHICFLPTSDSGIAGICIYDCIEFNDRFRYCDVASEIAFLAMDLDAYGRSDLSKRFVNDYVTFSGDNTLLQLLDFYKCYRAYVRGKVACFTLDDLLISEEVKARTLAEAKKYFELAETYII